MMGRRNAASYLGLLLGRDTGTYWYLVPSYALCFILPLTLPHSRLNEVANLEQLE